MKLKFIRLIASLVLFFFSFHQISFANPISSLPISELRNTKYDLTISIYDSQIIIHDSRANSAHLMGQGDWKVKKVPLPKVPPLIEDET